MYLLRSESSRRNMCPDADNGGEHFIFESKIKEGQGDGNLVGRGEMDKDATDKGETDERGNGQRQRCSRNTFNKSCPMPNRGDKLRKVRTVPIWLTPRFSL